MFAAHAGSSHVHIVVESEARLERIMNDLKSYASLCLNRSGWIHPLASGGHGTAPPGGYLRKACRAAVRYVVDEQGEPMSVFEASLS